MYKDLPGQISTHIRVCCNRHLQSYYILACVFYVTMNVNFLLTYFLWILLDDIRTKYV